MQTRRTFFLGVLAAALAVNVSVPQVFPEGDVWLGFRGEKRTALKRVVYSRVYEAGAIKQREFGGRHMPSAAEIYEAERRLYARKEIAFGNRAALRARVRSEP